MSIPALGMLRADTADLISAQQHKSEAFPPGSDVWTPGNVVGYAEGDRLNVRFELTSTAANQVGFMQVVFTGPCGGGNSFFDGTFALGTHAGPHAPVEPAGDATVVVDPANPTPILVGGDWVQNLKVTFTSPGTVTAYYTLRFSNTAGQCSGNGKSQLNGVSNISTGNQTLNFKANDLIQRPDITVIKRIDRDGSGDFESTATAGEFCFTLTGDPNYPSCVPTNASGQVVFTSVQPDGTHNITETQLNFSQGTYPFISGGGTGNLRTVRTRVAPQQPPSHPAQLAQPTQPASSTTVLPRHTHGHQERRQRQRRHAGAEQLHDQRHGDQCLGSVVPRRQRRRDDRDLDRGQLQRHRDSGDRLPGGLLPWMLRFSASWRIGDVHHHQQRRCPDPYRDQERGQQRRGHPGLG